MSIGRSLDGSLYLSCLRIEYPEFFTGTATHHHHITALRLMLKLTLYMEIWLNNDVMDTLGHGGLPDNLPVCIDADYPKIMRIGGGIFIFYRCDIFWHGRHTADPTNGTR